MNPTMPATLVERLFDDGTVQALSSCLAPPQSARPGDLVALVSVAFNHDEGAILPFASFMVRTEDGFLISSYSELLRTNEAFALKGAHAAAILHEDSVLRRSTIQCVDELIFPAHRASSLQPDTPFHLAIGAGWGLLCAIDPDPDMVDGVDPAKCRQFFLDSTVTAIAQRPEIDSHHQQLELVRILRGPLALLQAGAFPDSHAYQQSVAMTDLDQAVALEV